MKEKINWKEYLSGWENLNINIGGIINYTWDSSLSFEENEENFWNKLIRESELTDSLVFDLNELWEDYTMLIQKYRLHNKN